MSDCDNTDWIEYAHGLELEVKTLQLRIAELKRELQLEEELNHVAEGGFTQLSTTVKEQSQRIEELEQTLRELGYCTVCNSVPGHHLDEPFSSCNCGTSEDYATRPLQKAQCAQQHNIELIAIVKRLRAALGHLHHNAKASGAEMGLALDVAEEALQLTPKQSLAELNYITAYNAFHAGVVYADTVPKGTGDTSSAANEYAERIKDGDL